MCFKSALTNLKLYNWGTFSDRNIFKIMWFFDRAKFRDYNSRLFRWEETKVKELQKISYFQKIAKQALNQYRRGLETCPQAKTSKSGHAIFFPFFQRVRATSMTQRRVENTRVHFWTFLPVSVNHAFFYKFKIN